MVGEVIEIEVDGDVLVLVETHDRVVFGLVDEYFRQVEFLFCDMDIIEVGGQHCLLALRHVKFGQRVRIVFYRIVSQIS